MYKKDYLQRQLEEFGKVMAVLFGLRKTGNLEEYTKALELAFDKYSPFHSDEIEPLGQEAFNESVMTHFGKNTENLRMLADLLYEKFNFYLETDEKEKAKSLHLKCIYLYTLLQDDLSENEFNLDIHYRLSVLEALKNQL